MTDDVYLLELDFIKQLKKMLAWFKQQVRQPGLPQQSGHLAGVRPPIRFITHDPYSTYAIDTYKGPSGYDLDGDERAGQEYTRMVDGEVFIPVSVYQWQPSGNHKQLISFIGDDIQGTIKLILEGNSTTEISLAADTLTKDYLTNILEALPNVGAGNVKVTLWPGRWQVEFINDLSGVSFELFEVDQIFTAAFKVRVHVTNWADSGVDDEVLFPIPLEGAFDFDDGVINDAVPPGTIGTAKHFPGVGYVVDWAECREYNGDGTPDL